jgi:hypothetical protein
MSFRRLSIAFLVAQALGGAAWWVTLLAWPASRAWFVPRGASDATLLAFGVADGALFVGASALAAIGLWKYRPWAWPVLCVHAGAAAYAALYCWTLTLLTRGEAPLGAAMMTPSLVLPGLIAWRLRAPAAPGGAGPC